MVKDTAGKEIRLHVDKTSQLDGTFKAGDKIEAQATDKGPCIDPFSKPRRRCGVRRHEDGEVQEHWRLEPRASGAGPIKP